MRARYGQSSALAIWLTFILQELFNKSRATCALAHFPSGVVGMPRDTVNAFARLISP